MKPAGIPPSLLQKYLTDECTEAEKAQVEAWYESLRGSSEYLDTLPEEGQQALQDTTFHEIKNRLQPEEGQEVPRRLNLGWLIGIAASILLAIGIYFQYPGKQQESKPEIAAEFHRQSLQLTTFKNNEKRIVMHRLPDNSSVSMHPGAVITYPQQFEAKRRAVTFSGEGFFDIQKNPSKPFYIESGKLVIRVLGTSFNVKAPVSTEVFQVDVVTGSVSVLAKNTGGTSQQVILKPQEQALFELASGRLTARPIAIPTRKPIYEPVTIVFEETPVNQVIDQLEKRFKVNISLANPGVARCSVTANFESQPLSSILEMLCTTLDASYVLSGENITINAMPCD
ncbi:FecR family protein [Dyadobacter sp. Leaf189]|uniref:FecR family protein n=1 Tax=Dyadobacter sp. Leaf189 TaxID=1736295 RepID=UPI0006FE18BA|nr:FecR domain-containing protein [Dyadobacter sp. Leaf189]KQS33889.1 iron dicitrate transport regulator FecR [Dyadobacter sp. Leaf189]